MSWPLMAFPRFTPALISLGMALLVPAFSCSTAVVCPTSPTPCPSVFTMHIDLASLVGTDTPLQAYRLTLVSEKAAATTTATATTTTSASATATESTPPASATATTASQQCVFTTPLEPYLQPGCDTGAFTATIAPVEDASCTVDFPAGASCSVTQKTTELILRTTVQITSLSIQVERGTTHFVAVKGPITYDLKHPDGDLCPAACTVADVSIPFTTLVDTEAMK